MELGCRRVLEVDDKKRGCKFTGLGNKKRDAKNRIGLKAGTSCRALEKGVRKSGEGGGGGGGGGGAL